MPRLAALLAAFCLLATSPAAGQAAPDELPPGFDGPPAPVFPTTINRLVRF